MQVQIQEEPVLLPYDLLDLVEKQEKEGTLYISHLEQEQCEKFARELEVELSKQRTYSVVLMQIFFSAVLYAFKFAVVA